MVYKTLAMGAAATLGIGCIIRSTTSSFYFNRQVNLVEVQALTHDVNLFKFSVPGRQVQIPYSSPILVKAPNGSLRPFTPVYNDEEGFIQLAIKNYHRNASGSISEMRIGDTVNVFGPLPSISHDTSKHDQIYLIGAGAGITPLWSYMYGILNDKNSKSKIKLIYCNKTGDDIIFKESIEDLKRLYPGRFQFVNVLESTDECSNYPGTKISKSILEREINGNSKDPKFLVCGPPKFVELIAGAKKGPPFYQGSLGGFLKEMGYTNHEVVKY